MLRSKQSHYPSRGSLRPSIHPADSAEFSRQYWCKAVSAPKTIRRWLPVFSAWPRPRGSTTTTHAQPPRAPTGIPCSAPLAHRAVGRAHRAALAIRRAAARAVTRAALRARQAARTGSSAPSSRHLVRRLAGRSPRLRAPARHRVRAAAVASAGSGGGDPGPAPSHSPRALCRSVGRPSLATSACSSESDHVLREDVNEETGRVLLRGTKRPTRWRTVPIVTTW